MAACKIIPVFCFFVLSITSAQDLYTDESAIKMHLEFYDPGYKTLLEDNKESGIEIPARLTVNDEVVLDHVGVRYKGNSSYNIKEEKKSFNVSVDGFTDDQDLWGYETLNLNNGFVDPTYMREKITSDKMESILAFTTVNQG